MREGRYYNDERSRVMFRVRSNTLKLKDRERHTGGDVRCRLCGGETEDLEHFVVECWMLQEDRNGNSKIEKDTQEEM